MLASNEFNKLSFLKAGAIFAKGPQVWLLWGASKRHQNRPNQSAIFESSFFPEEDEHWTTYSNVLEVSRAKAKDYFKTDSPLFHVEAAQFEEPSNKTHSSAVPGGDETKETHQTLLDFKEASFQNFKTQFDHIQSLFEESELTKAVPYVFEASDTSVDATAIESFLSHSLNFEAGFLYGQWSAKGGVLGLSPEILLTQKPDGTFETMALAGTHKKDTFLKNPDLFLKDSKENHEHQLVVDDIRQQLESIADLTVESVRAHETPDLVHLLTPMSFQLKKDISLNALIERLHPTPALGCSPRKLTQETMKRFNELEPRGVFGAPFGFSLNETQADVVVAIRNLIWNHDCLKIGSGCGVVRASQLDKEWDELKNKRNSVKNIFGVR